MGLDATDRKPQGVTLAQAYENIRQWYAKNIALLQKPSGTGEYEKKSEALIEALPPAAQLTDLEIRAVLGEVIYGNLEWAYHKSDGHFKMAAYAHGALESAGLKWSLSDAERQQLKSSRLWPHLSIGR